MRASVTTRRTAIRGLAAAALVGAGRPARADEPIPLHVAMSIVNYDAAPLYYAQRSGLFAKAGLSVTIERINSGAATTAAVSSGSIDIGKATSMGVLSAFARGVEMTVVAPAAIYDASNPDGQLVVSPDSPIRTPKDLAGKTYGTTSLFDIDHIALLALLDKNGIDPQSVRVVEVPTSAIGPSLAAHRIDAGFQTEPLLTAAIAAGQMKPIIPVLSAIGARYLYSAWFAATKFVRSNPEAVRRFSTAIVQSQLYANAHHPELAPMVAELSGLPVSEVARVKLATCGTTLTPPDFQPIIDTAARYKGIARAFDARDLIWREAGK